MNKTSRIISLAIAGLSLVVSAGFATAQRQQARSRSNGNTGLQKIQVEKPDLAKIQKETLDPQSPFYFPKLYAKYHRNDTTMTDKEYRMLYLGYMFQEDYDPYRTSIYSGLTDSLRISSHHSKAEIDSIRKYAELSLEDNPFDLRQMSFLVHVLNEQKKFMTAKIWEYRLEHLLGAIKSTGTGEDTDNAWYVIYPMHEYDMVQLLGYKAVDAKFKEDGKNQFDYLVVEPDSKNTRSKTAKGFYFNVTVPQEQYILKHPEDATDPYEQFNGNEADETPAN